MELPIKNIHNISEQKLLDFSQQQEYNKSYKNQESIKEDVPESPKKPQHAYRLSLYNSQQKFFKEQNNISQIQKRRDSLSSYQSTVQGKQELEPQSFRNINSYNQNMNNSFTVQHPSNFNIQFQNNNNYYNNNNEKQKVIFDTENYNKEHQQNFNQQHHSFSADKKIREGEQYASQIVYQSNMHNKHELNIEMIKVLQPTTNDSQNKLNSSQMVQPSSINQQNILQQSNLTSNLNLSEHSKFSERQRLNSRNILKKKLTSHGFDDTHSQKSQKMVLPRSKKVTLVPNEYNADNDTPPKINNNTDFNFIFTQNPQYTLLSPSIKNKKRNTKKPVTVNIIIIAKIKAFIDKLRASVNIRSEKKLRQIHYNLIHDYASQCNIVDDDEDEQNRKNSFKYKFNVVLNNFTKFYDKIFKKCHVVDPSNIFRILMDILQTILITVILFSYSINICMYSNYVEGKGFQVFSICSIIMFTLDIIANFFTAFYIKGSLEKNPSKIAQHYIKTDFFFDLTSTICLYIQSYQGLPEHLNTQSRILKVTLNDWHIILTQIGLFCKIVPLKRLYYRLNKLVTMGDGQLNVVTFLKLMIFVFTLAHFVALSWYIVAMIQIEYYNENNTWLHNYELSGEEWYKQYIMAYYWAGATMMTVGTQPFTSTEQFYTTIMMFVTCGAFGYVLQVIGMLLSDLNKKKEDFQNQLNIINKYMRKNKIDEHTRDKVREYLEYLYIEGEDKLHNKQENEIISTLSQNLQNDIAKQVSKNLLQYFPFMQENFSQETLKKLIYQIEEVKYSPGEIIIDQQNVVMEKNHSIYLIQKGYVQIFFKNNQQKKDRDSMLKLLGQKQCFGQEGFFTGQQHSWTVQSIDFCTVLKISRNKFMEIIREKESDFEIFCEMKDRMIFNQEYNVIDLKCFACDSKKHATIDCQSTHYIAQKDRIIQKYNFSTNQKRDKVFKRKRISRFYALKIVNKCSDAIKSLEQEDFYKNILKDMALQRQKYFQVNANQEEDEDDEEDDDDTYDQVDEYEYDDDDEDDEYNEQYDTQLESQQVQRYPGIKMRKQAGGITQYESSNNNDLYSESYYQPLKQQQTYNKYKNKQIQFVQNEDNFTILSRQRQKSIASAKSLKSRGRINSSYDVQKRGKSPSIDIKLAECQFGMKTPSITNIQQHQSNFSNQPSSNLENKINNSGIQIGQEDYQISQPQTFANKSNQSLVQVNIPNAINNRKGSTFDQSNSTQDNNLNVPTFTPLKRNQVSEQFGFNNKGDQENQTKISHKASSYQDYESLNVSQNLQTRSRGSTMHQFNRQNSRNTNFGGIYSPAMTAYGTNKNKFLKQKSNFTNMTRNISQNYNVNTNTNTQFIRRFSKQYNTISTFNQNDKTDYTIGKFAKLDDVQIKSYQRYFPNFNIDQIVKLYKKSLKVYKHIRSLKNISSKYQSQDSKNQYNHQSSAKFTNTSAKFKLDNNTSVIRKSSYKEKRSTYLQNYDDSVLQNINNISISKN